MILFLIFLSRLGITSLLLDLLQPMDFLFLNLLIIIMSQYVSYIIFPVLGLVYFLV